MGKSKDLATRVGIDDNADATAITIDSSERVGIGTVSPDYALTVEGTSHPRIRLNATDNTASGLFMHVSNSGSQTGTATLRVDGSGNYSVYNGTSSSPLTMNIDGSGRMTIPSQPAFYAYTTNDSQNSNVYLTSSSSSTSWSESFDNNNNFSDGVFTAPIAGKYYFSVMWNRNGVQSRIAIRKNNSNYMRWEPTGRTDDTWESQQYSVLMSMAANDYVSLYLEYAGTSTHPAHMGGGAWGHFAGYLIA